MRLLMLILTGILMTSCTSVDYIEECFYKYEINDTEFCYEIRGDRWD